MVKGATRYVTIAVVERLTGRVPHQLTAWLKPYLQECTAAGWPVERVVQVLTAHGEAITAEQLLAAARERPTSAPSAAQPSEEASTAIRALTERLDSVEAEVAQLRQQLTQGQPRPPRRPIWAQN